MTTERLALVPVEATPEMISAGYDVRPIGQFIPGFTAQESADYCEKYFGRQTLGARHAAMVQASPGAALLAEVLAARDDAKESAAADKRNGGYGVPDQQSWLRVMRALDKLGPAAEGAT